MTEKRAFFSTSVFVAIGRAAGLLIPFYIAHVYGAGMDSDAFFMAFAIVLALSNFISPVFHSVLVPILAEYRENREKIYAVTHSVLWRFLPWIFLGAMFAGWGIQPILMNGSGWDVESAGLARTLFFEMMPFLILTLVLTAYQSVFYVHGRFYFPAISPLIRSAWVLGCIFFLHRTMGIHAVSTGYSSGEILRWVVMLLIIVGFSLWKKNLSGQAVKSETRDFFRQAGLQIPGFIAINLIPLTDRWFASLTGQGNISLLSYSDRLFQIPYLLFMGGILNIFFADWAKSYQNKTRDQVWPKIRKDLRNTVWITLAVSTVLFFLKRPLVHLIYGSGSMSSSQLETLIALTGWYMVGLMPGVLHLLYTRILFMMKKSAVFCLLGWLQFMANVVLNYILMKYFGVTGIVMATVAVFCLTATWMGFYLNPRLQSPEVLSKEVPGGS